MAETVKFKILGGEITPEIEIPVSATIPDLKTRIETILGIAVGRQTLRYNNRELVNDQKIQHYNFGRAAELILKVTPPAGRPRFNISAKSNYNAQVKVKVKETTRVSKLKKKLEEHWIFSTEDLTLYRLGQEMEDDFPLSAYYISEGAHIEGVYR